MKTLKIIGILFLIAVIAIIIILSHYGLYANVTITEKEVGPYTLVYKKHIGDYTKVGSLMSSIKADLETKYNIKAEKSFGLYFDNPETVDADKLRSVVGYIIENKTVADLENLKADFSVKEYPKSKSVVSEFPYKGLPSIIIGIFRVYPDFMNYIETNNYPLTPIMEIYNSEEEKIEYISSVKISKEAFADFLK